MSLTTLLTKENITFLLATIGSVGTILTWIYSAIKNRKNIDITYADYHINKSGAMLYAMICNKSHLPILITDISFKMNDIYYPANKIPEIVLTTTHKVNNEVTQQQEYYSMSFPIALTGMGATSGYLYFPFHEEIEVTSSNTLTLLVSTNRGRALKMKLPLNADQ